MIYVLATLFGLAASFGSLASDVASGNIRHVKNGRQPNAGAALFPVIPIVPLLFVGSTRILEAFLPYYSLIVLIGSFVVLSALWAVSFVKLRAELKQTIADHGESKHSASKTIN